MEIQKPQTTETWEIEVHVKGIKKKCRKTDWHYFDLTTISYTEDVNHLIFKDDALMLANREMKKIEEVSIKFTRFKNDEHIKRTILMDKDWNKNFRIF